MPVESCVKYFPEEAMLLRESHVEIWTGIPSEYKWEDGKSGGTRFGLRANGSGVYIWVDPDTRAALERDSSCVLLVIGWRRSREVRFWSVTASYASPPWPSQDQTSSDEEYLEKMIEKAREVNGETLREVMRKQEEERRRRPTPPPEDPTPRRSRAEEREAAYQSGWRRVK